jgi:hypothetical protein
MENIEKYLSDIEQKTSKRIIEIDQKISDIKERLRGFGIREQMVNDVIHDTNLKLLNTDKNNSVVIANLQKGLLRNIELLNIMHESISKYEDILIKLIKMKSDLDQTTFNNASKVLQKADDSDADVSFGEVQRQMISLQNNPLVTQAMQELESLGFSRKIQKGA